MVIVINLSFKIGFAKQCSPGACKLLLNDRGIIGIIFTSLYFQRKRRNEK